MDIRQAQQIYRDAVKEVFPDNDVFYINPLRFNGNMEDDLESFYAQYNEQFPNQPLPYITRYSAEQQEEFHKMLIEGAREGGPYAVAAAYTDSNMCIVNEPDEVFGSMDSIVQFFINEDMEHIKPYPGMDEDYIRFIGHHEATHCHGPAIEGKEGLDILRLEAFADYVASNRADPAVAQYIDDLRAYTSIIDPEHATNVILEPGENPGAVEQKDFDAINGALEEIQQKMNHEFGYPEGDVFRTLYAENRELFHQTLDRMIDDGVFADNPLREQYIQEYSEAAQRLLELDQLGNQDGPDTEIEQMAEQYVEQGAVLDAHGKPVNEGKGSAIRDSDGNVVRDGNGGAVRGYIVTERQPYNTDGIKMEQPSSGDELPDLEYGGTQELSGDFDVSTNPANDPSSAEPSKHDNDTAPTKHSHDHGHDHDGHDHGHQHLNLAL